MSMKFLWFSCAVAISVLGYTYFGGNHSPSNMKSAMAQKPASWIEKADVGSEIPSEIWKDLARTFEGAKLNGEFRVITLGGGCCQASIEVTKFARSKHEVQTIAIYAGNPNEIALMKKIYRFHDDIIFAPMKPATISKMARKWGPSLCVVDARRVLKWKQKDAASLP
jgi:hypothetical protein